MNLAFKGEAAELSVAGKQHPWWGELSHSFADAKWSLILGAGDTTENKTDVVSAFMNPTGGGQGQAVDPNRRATQVYGNKQSQRCGWKGVLLMPCACV